MYGIDTFNYFKSPKSSEWDSTRIKVNERKRGKITLAFARRITDPFIMKRDGRVPARFMMPR